MPTITQDRTFGHLSNKCPQRRAVAYVDGEEQEESDQDPEEDTTFIEADEKERLSCVLQRILLTPKTEQHPQRHSLFHTRCTVNGKVCNVISGNSENVVSLKLVKALNLKMDPHPHKIGRIRKGGEAQPG